MGDDYEALILQMRRLREAGHVKRCHALMHYDVGYTDGKHSFDAVSILLVFNPKASGNLIRAVLWHDAAERYAGDLPASAKFASTILKFEYEKLEMQIMRTHYPEVAAVLEALTVEERNWLTAIDAIEFLLWCQDQIRMGNRLVKPAFENIKEFLLQLENDGRIPEPLCSALASPNFMTDRLPERYDR